MKNDEPSSEILEILFFDLIKSFRKLSKNNDAGYTGDFGYNDFSDEISIGLFFDNIAFKISYVNDLEFNLHIEGAITEKHLKISQYEVEQYILALIYEDKKNIIVENCIDMSKWKEEGVYPVEFDDKILHEFNKRDIHNRETP